MQSTANFSSSIIKEIAMNILSNVIGKVIDFLIQARVRIGPLVSFHLSNADPSPRFSQNANLQFCRSNSYLLSRRAKKIAVDGRDYVDFSYPAPPVGIEATPNKADEKFASRKSIEEEGQGTRS
ncbi:hypothetical protein P3L10_000867 [Capsicum annuum]